jgi:hypothetical protein
MTLDGEQHEDLVSTNTQKFVDFSLIPTVKNRWHGSYAPLGIMEVVKYKARPGHPPGFSFGPHRRAVSGMLSNW